MKKHFLFLALLPLLAQAQISTKVSQNYPAHIVYKIDDLLEKMPFDEATQIKIAQKFQKTDSLANASLAQGLPVGEWKNKYTIDKDFLKELISRDDRDRFDYLTNQDNRFLAALNAGTAVKLNPEQLQKIRSLHDSLDAKPKMATKDLIQFQTTQLNRILQREQFYHLMHFIYKDQSFAEAKTDWNTILNLKINTPGKEKEEFKIIADYHMNKNFFLDKKAERYDSKTQKMMVFKAALMEPPLLIRANILSNQKYANNKYASVVSYEKELQLSQKQIDSLLSKYVIYEKIKLHNSENLLKKNLEPAQALPVEFNHLVKILTADQINKWMLLKNKNDAIVKAKVSWKQLEKEGLTKDIEREKQLNELATYFLNYAVAVEKSKSWKTQESLFQIRDVEQKKPEILRQHDAIRRSKAEAVATKKALTW